MIKQHLALASHALFKIESDPYARSFRSMSGVYDPHAVAALREKIQLARQSYQGQHTGEVLQLQPDRSRTDKELADQLRARLAEIGYKPQDVLVRNVSGASFVHTPTARSLECNSSLAAQLGVGCANSTWASEFHDTTPLCLDRNQPVSLDYMIFKKSALMRIDHVGQMDVARPFYVFIGVPQAAVIAKVFDGASQPLYEPRAVYLKRTQFPQSRP